jgi:1,4-dihydroxy-2-naphthoate octaprenyltransferase
MSGPATPRRPDRAALPAWRRRLIGGYLELRVIPVLLWSFSAITLGTALAWHDGGPRAPGWFVVALLVGLLLQGVVAHAVNDVTDWRSGTDRDPAPRILSGGSKVLPAALLSEQELRWMGIGAGLLAAALGLIAAAMQGWWLLAFGAVGVAGAVAYTLPPVAAAYVPFAGECIAFGCVLTCTVGAFALQRSEFSWDAVLLGAAHAAFCVGMLMLHHYLDRGPDGRADPPKRTSIVALGPAGHRYGLGWSMLAAALAIAAVMVVDARVLPLALAGVAGAVLHLTVRVDQPGSVTRVEAAVIAAGILGALTTSILLAPEIAWVALVPAVLVPVELATARRWLAPSGPDDQGTPQGGPPSLGPQRPIRA